MAAMTWTEQDPSSSAWNDFFRDPSDWWDVRSNKRSPAQPDFKHKLTNQFLWMESRRNPPWVKGELLARGYVSEQAAVPSKTTPTTADSFSISLIWHCRKRKDLLNGTRIHHEVQKRGLIDEKYAEALATMYAKCGEPQKGQALLEMHDCVHVVPWTAVITGYARLGQGGNAFDCFEKMQQKGISPNAVTFVCILKACAVTGDLRKGKEIHDQILRQGFLKHNIVLGNALVDMYAKCGALHQAQAVLDSLPSRNIVSWNGLIAGYAQAGQVQNILECCAQMQLEEIAPDAVTYISMVKACTTIGALDKGKQIHNEISRQGLLEVSVELGNALVDMYAKCDALPQAKNLLEKLPCRNVVTWNALITGYAHKGKGREALDCYKQMMQEGVHPDAVTFTCVLKACAAIGDFEEGKEIHEKILREGGWLEHHTEIGNALVDMYAKCGALPQAESVLDKLPARDVISWSALISGYAIKGEGERSLQCFERMKQDGIFPNSVTYLSLLQACTVIGAIEKGKLIHDEILRQQLLEANIELGGGLVDMYAKCGDLPMAKSVLEKLSFRNVIVYNALLAGYSQSGQGKEVLKLFRKMQLEGVTPNAATYVCILKACAAIGAIDKGEEIHKEISKQGMLGHSVELGGALVDMYAKCGAVPQARAVLEELPTHNTVMWNAVITGYAQEGQGEQAFKCFDQMQHENIKPDRVTYLCLLSLCSHMGLVEKGQELFDSMEVQYGLKPDVECFSCMVDLLGRAGNLLKAVEVLEGTHVSADSSMWLCLLGACCKWVDVNVGSWAFERALEIDKSDGTPYVLMAGIYEAAGMQEKANNINALKIKNKA